MDREATAEFIASMLGGSLWDTQTYGAYGTDEDTSFVVEHYATGLRFKVTVEAERKED